MTDARIFVSRLVGLSLLASDGSTVARLVDVVVGYPAFGVPPAVVGFVAEVQRRQIFVGANRVAELSSAGARLASGAIDLRRFKLRSGELLVTKDLFDRRVGRELLNDIALRPTPGYVRSWEVASVSFVGTSVLRRRRTARLASWEILIGLFAVNTAAQQASELRELHPADAAAEIVGMTVAERAAVVDAMDNEDLADLIVELEEDEQVALLESLDVERAADVIEEMEVDDAVDLLAELPENERNQIIEEMDADDAQELRRLLAYSPLTAGGLMNPDPVILGPESTVAEALARIRDPDLPAAEAAHVFVCEHPLETPTGRYLGPAGFQRLLREPPGTRLAFCLDEGPEPVSPEFEIADVAKRLASYDVVAVPVVDDERHLLGAVSIDDVLDKLLPEGWRRR